MDKLTKKIGRFSVSQVQPTSNKKTIIHRRLNNRLASNIKRKKSLKKIFRTLEISSGSIINTNSKVMFKLIEKINEGAQGQVWQAQLMFYRSQNSELATKIIEQNNGDIFAIKIMNIVNEKQKKYLKKEIKNSIKLTQIVLENPEERGAQNITKLFIHDQLNNYDILIYEYINGSDLKINTSETAYHIATSQSKGMTYYLKYIEQLVYGLAFMHKHNIVHRDIKPQNIMNTQYLYHYIYDPISPIEVPLIKYVDFGLSCGLYETNECLTGSTIGMVGTPSYIAPELYDSKGTTIEDAKLTDVYSLGITLFNTIRNFGIFDHEDLIYLHPILLIKAINKYIPIKSYYYSHLKREPYKLLDFILNLMIENNPKFRIDSESLQSIFTGEYIYNSSIPFVEEIQKINEFELEDISVCDTTIDVQPKISNKMTLSDIYERKIYQFHSSFLEKDLKCQIDISKQWGSEVNFDPSICHAIQLYIDRGYSDLAELNTWLELVTRQHTESKKISEKNYPDHHK